MRRMLTTLLAAIAMALLASCASGPKYAEVSKSFPRLAPDQGRIWFYRSGIMFGAGIQPNVLLNGVKVGDSVPGGFFYVDRQPGNQEVLLSTEVERKATFTLAAGQEQFVRMTVTLGVIVYRVYPELVDGTTARSEMVDLSYIGGSFAALPAQAAGSGSAPAPRPAGPSEFIGRWSGIWGKSLPHELVVQKIEDGIVSVVYSWGVAAGSNRAAGSRQMNGSIDSEGSLKLQFPAIGADVTYRMSEDRTTLSGTYVRDGRTTPGTFRRQ